MAHHGCSLDPDRAHLFYRLLVPLALEGRGPLTVAELVLIDSLMVRMDGVDATRIIRAGEAPGERVPIIAVTGAIAEADQSAYAAAGMDGVLAKPVSRAELAAALDRIPRRARLTSDPTLEFAG